MPERGAAKLAGALGTTSPSLCCEDKWLRGGAPVGEPLIGSADVQSLADMGNSFSVVREMRTVPFSMQTIAQLATITLLPVAPLVLTMIPLEAIVDRILKMIL